MSCRNESGAPGLVLEPQPQSLLLPSATDEDQGQRTLTVPQTPPGDSPFIDLYPYLLPSPLFISNMLISVIFKPACLPT